ncbi:hypothetical protein [Christiangramia echinicola]|uniref:Lipoprotein n=1 Tax=Christiangramia echinicola TaxID=279359 RepID=A0A1H1PKQ6_9FLAO|nr:hypothetical protein [Christiangramia echinicola]SDS11818.1 hypothetical protein SAMN04488552_2155 [Christiangramia echinicola]
MKIVLSFLICLLFYSCKSSKQNEDIFEEGKSFKNFRGYEPVDPVEFEDKLHISDGKGSLIFKNVKLLTREETLGFLNNETVLVSIGEINREGTINYLPITFSKKNTSYKITMDYMKYATLAQISQNEFIGSKRVGIGLRLISLITTAESGINISDLYSIGLAAKEGKLSGTLIIEVIGIKSKEVTSLIPLPSEINQTTIQNAMQALATIKSKIYDEETSLYPQVMAVKKYVNETNSEDRDDEIIPPNVSAGMEIDLDNVQVNPTQPLPDKNIQLQFGNIRFSSEERKNEASQLLSQSLNFILDREVEKAIEMLEIYESAFPLYSVAPVLNNLKNNREVLRDKEAQEWQIINNIILNNYRERLSETEIEKLKKS